MAGGSKPEKTIDWTDPAETEEVIRAISCCKKYQDEGGAVEIVRTPVSTVFLTPRFVFKFKRPLELGFVDFSRLKKRRHFCREELRLNRRLAKGVYLGVLPLWAEEDGYQFEKGGAIVDYAVVMKRLAPGRMLEKLVGEGAVGTPELELLAARLAQFHSAAPRGRELAGFGELKMVNRNWEEIFFQTSAYINITVDAGHFRFLQQAVFGFLTRNRDLLERRAQEGFVRDGHGDLRCEHIYLYKKAVSIIDCIDYSDRFRIGDVASDLAFLLMDFCALGRPELSRSLLEKYVEASGDRQIVRLIPFYACYRAFMRGKVSSFQLSDEHLSPDEQQRILNRARSFFLLAREFAAQMQPPVMLLMAGLMGTGKSTLGEAISRETGIALFGSGRVRQELAAAAEYGKAQPSPRKLGYREGRYGEIWNRLTYETLFERAEEELAQGRSVILDASFQRRKMRVAAFELARSYGARGFVVECRLPEGAALERLAQREESGASFSNCRAEIYSFQKDAFEPIDELGPENHLRLQTDHPVQVLKNRLLKSREENGGLASPRLNLPPPLFSMPAHDSAAAARTSGGGGIMGGCGGGSA